MTEIHYIDRISKQTEHERVYGKFFIEALYGHPFSWLSALILIPLCKIPFFSKLYGYFQKSRISRFKILPFIRKFHVDTSEFLEPVSAFRSFNDFFIRKLKPEMRPLASGVVLPADARYLFYSDIEKCEGFLVKGKKFDLVKLLGDEKLAQKYAKGSMAIARLCPTDYHRFHFPCDAIPSAPRLINGPLYSVNLLALKRNINILIENKRMITELQTEQFGTVLYIEVGATYVGSIIQTYTPHQPVSKGEEKGYFSFGGSCIILLFEPSRIVFDADLLDATARGLEIRGLMGQSMGHL